MKYFHPKQPTKLVTVDHEQDKQFLKLAQSNPTVLLSLINSEQDVERKAYLSMMMEKHNECFYQASGLYDNEPLNQSFDSGNSLDSIG